MVIDQGNQEISKSLQLVASRTAQEYNRRKKRKGAFWEDRYHATAVQSGDHLIRCLVYVDLNMVRAGVVSHPAEWEFSGFNEIQTPRARKGVIDHASLCDILGISSIHRLRKTHKVWVEDEMMRSSRDQIWTESCAVGGEDFLAELKAELQFRGRSTTVKWDGDNHFLGESSEAYSRF